MTPQTLTVEVDSRSAATQTLSNHVTSAIEARKQHASVVLDTEHCRL